MISGIWQKVKSKVIGMMPQTLKATQAVGREIARQTISLSDRQEQEEQAPAQRQLAPALGIELEGGIEDIAEQRLAEGRGRRAARTPNSVLMMVGFILMKTSSCR